MDEPVIKMYRKMIHEGFQYTGSFEHPSIFLDSVGEKISICVRVAKTYVHIYIMVKDNKIDDIKYLCMCDPTANVAAEILCELTRGKTLTEAKSITTGDFIRYLGGSSNDMLKSAKGLIELLNRGIARYQYAANS